MQVCTSLKTDNHASTPPLSSYRPDALPVDQSTASKHWRHLLDSVLGSKNVTQFHVWWACMYWRVCIRGRSPDGRRSSRPVRIRVLWRMQLASTSTTRVNSSISCHLHRTETSTKVHLERASNWSYFGRHKISAGLTMWQMWQMPRASGLRGPPEVYKNFPARQ